MKAAQVEYTTNAVRTTTVTTGSTHQVSWRRVGLSGPPRAPEMATGVVLALAPPPVPPVASSTVVVTRTSSAGHSSAWPAGWLAGWPLSPRDTSLLPNVCTRIHTFGEGTPS